MKVTIEQLLETFRESKLITEVSGNENAVITGFSSVEECGPGDLVIADNEKYALIVEERHPKAVVTSPKFKKLFSHISDLTILIAPNVGLAHAFLKQKYHMRDFNNTGWRGIHPSAVIHESAVLDETVIIEPRVVIGKNAKIGKNTRIMAGAIIENDAVIGDEVIIHPLVVIGYECKIGNQVVIESGSVIGSEGFGFAQNEKRKSFSIPQTGHVVIEDHVRIGANNTIDRATYSVTRVGAGTKTDNLCHIAHNVNIGEDCLLTAMLCVAGSAKIGDRVITSGQTGILDHTTICSDAVFVHRAGVAKDVEKPGIYAGVPLLPLPEYLKNSAALKNAADLRKRLIAIEKHLGLSQKETD